MKNNMKTQFILLVALSMTLLSACSKNGGDNNNPAPVTAITPVSTVCTTSADGTMRDQNGIPCANGSQTICGANGYYTYNNQQMPCTPNGLVYNGGYYPAPNTYYGYQANPNGQACAAYTYQTGQPYVPVYGQNYQIICVNYYLLLQAAQQSASYYGTYYYNYGPDYFYSYPPYAYSGSGYCSVGIYLNAGSFSGQLCF